MKKLLTAIILTIVSASAASGETLFPTFVDLVRNYTTASDSPILMHHIGATDGGGETSAKTFLKDTLPESYNVVVDENKVGNRIVTAYCSTMTDDKISVIYFIREGDRFSIEYAEGSFINVIPYCN